MNATAKPPTSPTTSRSVSAADSSVYLHLTKHPRLQPWANYDGATPDDGLPLEPLDGWELAFHKRIIQHQDTDQQRFRFRNAPALRALMLRALPWAEANTNKIARFLECGDRAFLQFSPSRKAYRHSSNGCSLRTCPACAANRRRKLKRRILFHLSQHPRHHFRFITLTLKHSDAPLADQLEHLKASFRRLRQTTTWKSKVYGGLAVIEITRHRENKTWHPHLHILARGLFIPQALLSRLWSTASRGSWIVDIRAVAPGDQAAEEISGYLGKVPHLDKFDDAEDAFIEYYKAIDGQRLVQKFGDTAKEPKSLPDPDDDGKPNDWQDFLSFADFLRFCKKRCIWASQLLSELLDNGGQAAFERPPPKEVLNYVIQPRES